MAHYPEHVEKVGTSVDALREELRQVLYNRSFHSYTELMRPFLKATELDIGVDGLVISAQESFTHLLDTGGLRTTGSKNNKIKELVILGAENNTFFWGKW